MRGLGLKAAAMAAMIAIAACAGYPNYAGTGESVTIPYDPYNYDPDELLAQAEAHCNAYNRRAVYIDETVDPNSVRWRYRHFRCVA